MLRFGLFSDGYAINSHLNAQELQSVHAALIGQYLVLVNKRHITMPKSALPISPTELPTYSDNSQYDPSLDFDSSFPTRMNVQQLGCN